MRRRGFTILELLIAMAILGTIFAMIYMSFAATIETKVSVEHGNELYGMARLAMDRMTRELSMAYLRPRKRDDETNFTIFLGEDRESEGYPMDTLTYTSVSHIRFGAETVKECDQNELAYYPIENNQTNERILMYREDTTIDEENLEGGVHYELCLYLYGINFRYFDEETTEWVDQWDSQEREDEQAGLPRAVEITLILRGEQDEELIFQSKVMVSQ